MPRGDVTHDDHDLVGAITKHAALVLTSGTGHRKRVLDATFRPVRTGFLELPFEHFCEIRWKDVADALAEKLLGRCEQLGRIPGVVVQVNAIRGQDEHEVGHRPEDRRVSGFAGPQRRLGARNAPSFELTPVEHRHARGEDGTHLVDRRAVGETKRDGGSSRVLLGTSDTIPPTTPWPTCASTIE
jgi:hypothetical protein